MLVPIDFPSLRKYGVMPYRWTVDVEYDWGGRTDYTAGIRNGLPIILETFKKNNIKALFFLSTELITGGYRWCLDPILDAGHQIGSHGHRHVNWKHSNKAFADGGASMAIIYEAYGIKPQNCFYRAPKFSSVGNSVYSDPKNHVSLLKHMWLGQKIREETIIYLHPFDIVKAECKAPNLFCKLWYSRPEKARQLLSTLVNRYK